jgi:hypothetical protein
MGITKRPNLFIVGAMKSGTTSLHNYLGAHPGVFMCEPKEPGYFVEELTLSRGPQWYSSLFDGAKDETILGESSTHYAKLPVYRGVPERIAQFNEHARFIYVMRDPVQRVISHYWHNVRNLRWEAERRDMLTAVKRDPQYQAFSDYAMQLEPYIKLFGRDRIYVTTFESLTTEPCAAVQAVFRWLGVDQTYVPPTLDRRWNSAPEKAMRVRGLGLLNMLRHSPLWGQVAPWIPAEVRAFGNKLAERPVSAASEPADEVVDYLRPRLQDRTTALVELLGRDFPEWATLWGTGERRNTGSRNLGVPGADPQLPVR